MNANRDWNARYQQGDTPWDHDQPSRELLRVLGEHEITPCRILELGCGTGANAVYLAQQGFQVTAFDIAPLAVERAQQRADEAGVDVRFFTASVTEVPEFDEPFPMVFDRGVYHVLRQEMLDELLWLLQRVTTTGSRWLTLAGNANDPAPMEKGPPRVRASELCSELESLFVLTQLREFHFDASGNGAPMAPLAWSALWRRR